MPQLRRLSQLDVVCKMAALARPPAEVLQSPRLGRELSCCLQAARLQGRPAKRWQRNALGPELRCCLQDRRVSASGPDASAGHDFARLSKDSSRGTVSSTRDDWRATCANCRGTRRDIRHRWRVWPGDNRSAVAVGNPAGYRPLVEAETWRVGSSSDSSGSAVRPFGCCRIPRGGWDSKADI